MKITNDIINDLIPLYVANECSADTRALVEEFLQSNPAQAQKLRQVLSPVMSAAPPAAKNDEEMRAYREARRRLRRRTWLMALAIFFSLVPLSFIHVEGHTWWLIRDAPHSALAYGAVGVALWLWYGLERLGARNL